jgi:CHAT domain-containing protein
LEGLQDRSDHVLPGPVISFVSDTAIHEALTERRYHVLHISCHAAPGALILETADGAEDRVTAKRLCDESIPAGRTTPLIVLAGCSTGQDGKTPDGGDADKLPGLARTLVQRGVPAVIDMQAPVGDHYATDLMAEVYAALANWQKPHPLAALGHARRVIERKRRDDASPSHPRRNGRTQPSSAPRRPRTCSTRTRNPKSWRKSRRRSSIPAWWCGGSATWSDAGANSG